MQLTQRIKRLKKERNAVILAHNYQMGEVQDAADYVGDSLGLSIQAAKTDAETIVFCGVYFMAETAKILSPRKLVLIPDWTAGCPMADMISADELRKLKSKHPGAKVICYVNSTAEVKAECDLCCTSANAVEVVRDVLKVTEEIIFVPDKYLARYVSDRVDHDLISWHGYCPTHARIFKKDIEEQRRLHPAAEVLVHPECTPEVIEAADRVLSTEGMCRYAGETGTGEYIIGTERGILHRLRKENPHKIFHPVSELAICPNMKLTNLEKVLWCLEELRHEVKVPEDIIGRARQSLNGMLKY
jgi:quinolinate synthase